MIRRPPRSTRTDTLFPYTTLFRSAASARPAVSGRPASDATARETQHARTVRDRVPPLRPPPDPRRGRRGGAGAAAGGAGADSRRSEERRVGKESVSKGRSRWSPYPLKKHL